MRPLKSIIVILTLVLSGGLVPSRAGAALLPGVNTLADLLNRGEVTVGDVRYYDFAYLRTAGNLPSARQVTVDAPADGSLGLSLSADWSASGAANRWVLLQFKVGVGPSVNRFASVTTTLTGRSATPAAVASVTDTVATLPSDSSPTINRVTAGTAGGTFSVTQPLSLAATGFAVSKVLAFQSSPTAGAVSAITTVSTTFVPTHLPEPVGIVAIGLMLAGLGMSRRRAQVSFSTDSIDSTTARTGKTSR